MLINTSLFGAPLAGTLNTPLLTATLIVDAVRRDVDSLLPQAQLRGSATVSSTRIQIWQSALQNAVSLLGQIPAPLIFPPPPFVTFINAATQQINQVLATLSTLPTVTIQIFPPQPSQVSIPLATLQSVATGLRQAELFLIQALQTA